MKSRRHTPSERGAPAHDDSTLRQASGPTFDMRLRAHFQDLLDKVAEFGWTVITVFPVEEGDGGPFAYTVGAGTVGQPDLVITGLGRAAAPILNAILAAAKAGLKLEEGAVYEEFANMPLALKRLTAAQGEQMNRAHWFNQNHMLPFQAFQVVYPDPNGIFPWESSYNFPAQEQLWER